jgi:hypothetical protein
MSASCIEWTHRLIGDSGGRLEGFPRPPGLSLQYVKDAGGNLRHIFRPPRDDVAAGRSQGLRFFLKQVGEFLGGQRLSQIMERARPPP